MNDYVCNFDTHCDSRLQKPKSYVTKRSVSSFINKHQVNLISCFLIDKPLWQIKNMVTLLLQHGQINNVKSSNVEELHYFFQKKTKSSSQEHENMKSGLPDACWWMMIQNVLLHMILVFANKNHNEYQNDTHNLQSFDSILLVFYSIMVFSVILDSSLITENVLDIQSFFLILAFHINDIDHAEFFYFQYSELYLRYTTYTSHIPHQYLGITQCFHNCSAYIRVVYCLYMIKHYAFTHFLLVNFEKWKFSKLNLSYNINFSEKKKICDHDFGAISFDAAHDEHNNLHFCIYCRFNCVLGKFTDIMCICPDLFLYSY